MVIRTPGEQRRCGHEDEERPGVDRRPAVELAGVVGQCSQRRRGTRAGSSFLRWKSGEFLEIEREQAKEWRAELAANDPERMIGIVKNILPLEQRISQLDGLKPTSAETKMGVWIRDVAPRQITIARLGPRQKQLLRQIGA